MRAVAITAVLLFAVQGWAQSLADLVRADRQQTKPHARKVFTNENLNEVAVSHLPTEAAATPAEEPPDGLSPDLHRMKVILRNICADPRTENGQNLSDDDKQAMNEGVKALRVRVEEFERIRQKNKDALAALDKDFEAKVVKAVTTGQPFSDAELQRVKSMWLERDARRTALLKQGDLETENYKTFLQQVESVGDLCPAAAEAVPD